MDRATVTVRGFYKDGARRKRLHDLPHGKDRAQGAQCPTRDAVVGPSSGDDLKSFLISLKVVMMLGQLDGRLDRLGAVTDKGKLIDLSRRNFRQDLGQLQCRQVGKLHGREVAELADLVIDRLGDLSSTVTDVDGPGDARDKVEVTLSILIETCTPTPLVITGIPWSISFLDVL